VNGKKGTVGSMSFTQDELQALNSIIEQKLELHRRELEQTFDQRAKALLQDFEHHLLTKQQDMIHTFSHRFIEQQQQSREVLRERLEDHQARTVRMFLQNIEHRLREQQKDLEQLLEQNRTKQLEVIEEVLTRRQPPPMVDLSTLYGEDEHASDFETIELQTEIPWEELVELIDKALADRLATLTTTLQAGLRDTERLLLVQIQHIRDTLLDRSSSIFRDQEGDEPSSMQEVFRSILQLEHIVESMQVAMTANSALLSNRLSHHQQLPFERAHARPSSLFVEKTASSAPQPSLSAVSEGETEPDAD